MNVEQVCKQLELHVLVGRTLSREVTEAIRARQLRHGAFASGRPFSLLRWAMSMQSPWPPCWTPCLTSS